MKRAVTIGLILLVNMALLAGNVVPHHHHYRDRGESICLTPTAEGENCAVPVSENGGGDCNFKRNLTAFVKDHSHHKRGDSCIQCALHHLFDGQGLFLFVLSGLTPSAVSASPFLSGTAFVHEPWREHYRSIVAAGPNGLRAPPVA